MKKKILLTAVAAAMCLACFGGNVEGGKAHPFVKVTNGQLTRGGKPYRFVGANMWYGAVLGSTGHGGDRARLCRELDSLAAAGVTNLRVLAGADGPDGIAAKVEPALQTAPGVYNDSVMAGLDYLISEMGRRGMTAVIYLNNAWEWSGGYGQYLEWTATDGAPYRRLTAGRHSWSMWHAS